MGQALAHRILGHINKFLNNTELTDEETVVEAEKFLGHLVSLEVIDRWERGWQGNGWLIYTSADPDGFHINWNDMDQSRWPPQKDKKSPEDGS
jgi:hypothetical protein